MPDRAVLVMRERDGALDGLGGNGALDVERAARPVRSRCGSSWARCATRCARRARSGWRPFVRMYDDVGRHAAGQRERQGLHRRRPGGAVAVDRHGGRARNAGEPEVAEPGEIGDGWRLRSRPGFYRDFGYAADRRRRRHRWRSCEPPRARQPPERQDHEQVGQHMAEDAVGSPRLGGLVDELRCTAG